MQTFSGLVSILTVFLWLGGNLVSPLRPICDLRVLDHFVREARDSEVIMRGCRGGCGVMKSYFVPLTSVDFAVWEHMDVTGQAVEVQTGLSLLDQALSNAMKTQARSTVLPDDSAPASAQTQEVSSLPELLQVQSSFLRGKVRLLLSAAPACQRQNS
ncbi:erythropoietin b isoform X3 [Carassius gibelio]|uniref:erythropoietin b isoform X3 n=1 Tax=Carassius gibelio TaxID=101364 RepID=UPI0022781209|nr:erythropoietin b isoform X3 [Carassius gibelio]